MQLSDTPIKVGVPFANGASPSFIRPVPIPSQIGIQSGAASFTDGFPPDCFTPVSAGGDPPFGQDFNGLLFQISGGVRWLQAGGPLFYDALLVSECGGYPFGAILNSGIVVGAQWYSLAENNMTNPDDPLTSANWARVGIPVGQPQPFIGTVSNGFIPMFGQTLGNVGSGSAFATSAAIFLYAYNWLAFPNTQCPIFTSAGVPTTRGANAIADFNANKRLTLPGIQGCGLIGVDALGSTLLAGVPIVVGNTTTPGSGYGENLHTLISTEVPATTFGGATGIENQNHTHTYTFPVDSGARVSGTGNLLLPAISSTVTGIENQNHTHNFSGAINGGGGSHNNTHRTMGVNWGQKL